MGTITVKKLPLVIEDMELGAGVTAQERGGSVKSYRRIGGSTLPYDDLTGPTIKQKLDSLDASGYTMSGVFDPSGGTEYPTTPSDGEAFTVSLPLGTDTYTFTGGDLVGWVTKAGDLMVNNAGWTLIKVSIASDDHLRLDGANTMAGSIRMGDTYGITNMLDGINPQDAATVAQVSLKVSQSSIVDDLVTGGPAVPLSAEQGKTLENTKETKTVVATKVGSLPENGVGTTIKNQIRVTQAEYDGLLPLSDTLYIIVD